MLLLAIAIFLLASTLAMVTLLFLMKTAELSAAVSENTAAVNGLSASVDAAIAVLINAGQPSTPDADIVPLIAAIEANTQTAVNTKAKLDAALTPPTP